MMGLKLDCLAAAGLRFNPLAAEYRYTMPDDDFAPATYASTGSALRSAGAARWWYAFAPVL